MYKQPKALLYRFPKAPGESGGPTIAYEAIREGIDDYRYLLTLSRFVDKARESSRPEVSRLAEQVRRCVQARLEAASFEGCKCRAVQGNWTGKCEMLPNGDRVVGGDHKIANNWQFDDYDALQARIADGIVRLRANLK